jgi:hypothetical protein
VQGQDGGHPRAPGAAEQLTAGERLQHRNTLPTAPASVAHPGPDDDGGRTGAADHQGR